MCGGTVCLLKVLYVPEFYKNIISGHKLLQNEAYKLVVSHKQASLINTSNNNTIRMPLQNNPNPLWYLHATRTEVGPVRPLINKIPYPNRDDQEEHGEVLNLKVANQVRNHKAQVKRLQEPPGAPRKGNTPQMDINIAHARMAHANEGIIRKTLMASGIQVTGTLQACGPCSLYKAKAKVLPKSASQAQFRGQRLHLDLSGPYSTTVTGDTYWVKIKDNYSKMSWNIFCKAKHFVPSILDQKLHQLSALHIPVKFL